MTTECLTVTLDDLVSGPIQEGDYTTTVAEAKTKLLCDAAKSKVECPCCGSDTKIYKRKLNSGMALGLIEFNKLPKKPGGWFFMSQDTLGRDKHLEFHHREYARLGHWGILETKQDQNSESGWWRITPLGLAFLKGNVKVPEHIYLMHNRLLRVSKTVIDIHAALGNEFDYEELMSSGLDNN